MAKQTRWKHGQRLDAIRQGQQETSALWRPHRSAMRFLEDHFPDEWAMIQHCHMSYRFKEDMARPGFYKRLPAFACHKVPFCIVCSRKNAYRRTSTALDHFSMCTPAGKQPRFIHVVQTAPLTDDGLGWGAQASQDIGAFGRVVWGALKENFGDGIGAIMSYQDFGEQGFAKRHPHMDLTLNGWMLQDGGPTLTPKPELGGQGKQRWDDLVIKHARSLDLEARRGNVRFDPILTGTKRYWRVLKYQMRELVDLRKLEYSRDQQVVWWKSYNDNRRTKMTVGDWICRYWEYKNRLGAWENGQGAQNLHRRYGHLAKGTLRKTQAIMGGDKVAHGSNCPCAQCGDWMESQLTKEEEAMNRAFRLKTTI